MNFWQVFLFTFSLIFLAELGDKTQLAVFLLAAQDRPMWEIFLGAAAALVLSSSLVVFFGAAISRYLPQDFIHKGAGAAFILIGFLLLLGKF